MTAPRLARAAAALALVAAFVAAPSAAQASTTCLEPRADAAGGATFTVTSGSVQSGGTVTFTGSGFTRSDSDGLGQTLAFKLNDQVTWTQTVKAADDGTVSGSLNLGALPAADVADIVQQACGKAWVRVLVGSSAAGDMAPSRSMHGTFTLAAAPAPGATPSAGATAPGRLPETGIEDVPPIGWIAGLVGIAGVAIVGERLVRRRAQAGA